MRNVEKNAFYAVLAAADVAPAIEHGPPTTPKGRTDLQDGMRLQASGTGLWFEFYKRKHKPGDKQSLFACRHTAYDFVAETFVERGWASFTQEYKLVLDGGYVYYGTLDETVAELQAWLTDVVPPVLEEFATPDMWQTRAVTAPLTLLVTDEGRAFTRHEQEDLTRSITELREFILQRYEATEEQHARITVILDRLAAAASTATVAAWITFATGTVVEVASALYLNNEQGRELLEMFVSLIRRALPFLSAPLIGA